jgi:glutamyl-Q tRNA(Asp) synthetase
VDAADPLPALHAAWLALGQSDAALADAATPRALLALALRHFDPRRIPATPATTLAAMRSTTVIDPR